MQTRPANEGLAAKAAGIVRADQQADGRQTLQYVSDTQDKLLSDGLHEENRPSEEISVHQQHLSENKATLSDGLREEGRSSEKTAVKPSQFESNQAPVPHTDSLKYWFATVFTFAMREGKELLRDKIRLFFAVLGPVILMSALSWSISFDVQNLTFAVLDRDQSSESRALTEYFACSRYFVEQPPLDSAADIDRVLKSAQTKLVIDIPPGFGRDLLRGNKPELGFYVDG